MKPQSRIRLQPPDVLQPRPAFMPTLYAKRWNSAFDEDAMAPLVSVFVTQPAYARICTHAGSDLDNEIGGVLIGEWCADLENEQQFIVVEYALPARFTRQGSIYLTFTQNTLVDIHAKIDEHFQDKQIVGWYHTHPRMGVFLSHYDTWLHNHFFPEPWQVALVVEPHSETGGFFIRQVGGSFDPTNYFGFYELEGNNGTSVVNWRNMQWTKEEEGG